MSRAFRYYWVGPGAWLALLLGLVYLAMLTQDWSVLSTALFLWPGWWVLPLGVVGVHTCAPSRTCTCYILALEPADDCPQHGYPWPPRCGDCGKFLPWPKVAQLASTPGGD